MKILFFSLLIASAAVAQTDFNADQDINKELQTEFEAASQPAELSDFDKNLKCAVYNYNSKKWEDLPIKKLTVAWTEGETEGRGPRFPGYKGIRKSIESLCRYSCEENIKTGTNRVEKESRDLVWIDKATKTHLRKSGEYIYMAFNNGYRDYYGYCWSEK